MGNTINNKVQVTDPMAEFLKWIEQIKKTNRESDLAKAKTPEERIELERQFREADAGGGSHTDRDGDGGTSEPNGHVMTRNQK